MNLSPEGDQNFATLRQALWDIDFKLVMKNQKTQIESLILSLLTT